MQIESELLSILKQYFVEERFDVRAYTDAYGVIDQLIRTLVSVPDIVRKLEDVGARGFEAIWVRVFSHDKHSGVIVFARGDLGITLMPLHKNETREIDFHHPDSLEKLHALVNFYCNQQLAEA